MIARGSPEDHERDARDLRILAMLKRGISAKRIAEVEKVDFTHVYNINRTSECHYGFDPKNARGTRSNPRRR